MNTRRLFLRRLLGDLFFFGFLHSVSSVLIFRLSGQLSLVWLSLLLALPFFFCSLVRHTIRSTVLFTLLHAAPLVGVFFVSSIPLGWRAFIAVFIFVTANYSFAVRPNDGLKIDTGALMLCCAANAALVLICNYMDIARVAFVPTAWAFFMLMAHLIYMQSYRLDASLELVSDKMRQPIQTITHFNNSIIFGFVLIAALFLLLAPFLPMDKLLSLVVPALLAALRWIIVLIMSIIRFKSPDTGEGGPPASTDNGLGDLGPGEAGAFWIFLEQLTYLVVTAAIIVGIIALIFYAVYSVYRSFFATRSTDGDIREYIGPAPLIEQMRVSWRNFFNRTPVFGDDDSGRIRRLYYKKVRRHIRRGAEITSSDTANEICEKLRTREDIDTLTEKYNHARYGNSHKHEKNL